MTDPRHTKVSRDRPDELQDEIDRFLGEEADMVSNARSVLQLIHGFAVYYRATGNRAPLPSVSTLRRRFARSLAQQQTTHAVPRLRPHGTATSRSSAIRLPVEDPARGFRRPHARPVLYVDPYTGAIISTL